MARYSIPSFSSLWQKHETLYVGIFIIALQRLSDDKCDTTDEDIISEYLCPVLNTVCFEESQKNNRQKLNRKNLKPEIFELVHLWVDLRSQ